MMQSPRVLKLSGVSTLDLARVDAIFDVGLHVIRTEEPGASSLLQVLDGSQSAKHGQVEYAGKSPYRSPLARARIASLKSHEALGPDSKLSVSTYLARLNQQYGLEQASELLDRLGLKELEGTTIGSLDQEQRRAVALALALGDPRAEVLVLLEPFSTPVEGELLSAELCRRADEGAIVILLGSQIPAALQARARVWLIAAGRLAPADLPQAAMWRGQIRVRCDDARGLAAALTHLPTIGAVEIRDDELVVIGRGLHSTAEAISQALIAHEITPSLMMPLASGVGEASERSQTIQKLGIISGNAPATVAGSSNTSQSKTTQNPTPDGPT